MRDDVRSFAQKMSDTLDRKHLERKARALPQYPDPKYPLDQARQAMLDKTEQLISMVFSNPTEPRDVDHLEQTAVHLANFALIIAAKVRLGQRITEEMPAESSS